MAIDEDDDLTSTELLRPSNEDSAFIKSDFLPPTEMFGLTSS